MKKITILLFLFLYFGTVKIVYANDIKSINMDIFVDQYGNANIKEEWIADLSSGTEGYKPYYNLGSSEIKNYEVTLNGKKYTTVNNWDTSASFDSKKYKAGLNPVDNGYELCFGISSYGKNNSYVMNYTITNFVSKLNDADMIYWQLVPYELSDKPESVYIKIHSDFKYSDNLPVWGYGNYGGYAYVYDGYIEMSNDDALDSNEYMTILVKFPKDTFQTNSIINEDFDYYLDMAQNGAKTYTESSSSSTISNILSVFWVFFEVFIISVVTIGCVKAASGSRYGTKNLKFNKGAKKLGDVPYFRDIPCQKDIFKAYFIACNYNLVKRNTDFLGAILLKWLKDKNIENVTVQNKKKEERAIKLISSDNLTEREVELFEMMSVASIDGVLESNEFTKWCKNHYNKILKWFNNVIDDVTMQYVMEGMISEENKTFGKVYLVSDELKNDAIKMAGLKKFLNEFSNIKDRESIEVNLWEEYLIYAQIFGIAEKVAKEFKKLYPDVLTDDYYNDIIFIHTISHTGVNAASVAKSRAESYSAGGGGFSSGGGGGGSFGGGGGGGFR